MSRNRVEEEKGINIATDLHIQIHGPLSSQHNAKHITSASSISVCRPRQRETTSLPLCQVISLQIGSERDLKLQGLEKVKGRGIIPGIGLLGAGSAKGLKGRS